MAIKTVYVETFPLNGFKVEPSANDTYVIHKPRKNDVSQVVAVVKSEGTGKRKRFFILDHEDSDDPATRRESLSLLLEDLKVAARRSTVTTTSNRTKSAVTRHISEADLAEENRKKQERAAARRERENAKLRAELQAILANDNTSIVNLPDVRQSA